MQQVLRNALIVAVAAMGMAANATTPALRALPTENARVAMKPLHQNATKATCNVCVLGDDYQPTFHAPASTTRADVMIDEDFANLTEGTPEEPTPIVEYGVGTMPVPDGLLGTDGWTANSLYSAGGMAYLTCTNPNYAAQLYTPQGDWSGSVTITFKVRIAKNSWGGGRARVQVAPLAYGTNFANTNIEEHYFEVLLQQKDGWAEVTLTYENYTADNEGTIVFTADSDVLIDDIKITIEPDFLASPTMLTLTNIKEDSFTINWMPVRKAREYYIHLYSVDGYNEDGTPNLVREWPSYFTQEDIDMYKDWVEQGWLTPDYLAYEQALMDTSYTFTGLDPEKEYYYCVESHLIDKFSSMDENYHAMFVAAPELLAATDVDREAGKYTANWRPVAKADGYYVNNYGVYNVAEDTKGFVLLDEDFSEMPSDAEGIQGIERVPEDVAESDYLNECTALPGWQCKYLGFVNGMAGVFSAFNGFITTPTLYVENSDQIHVKLGILAERAGQNILITFAGVNYELHLSDNAEYTEIEFDMPVNNYVESPIRFYSRDGQSLFLLDYLTVSQDVAAGSQVYVFQEQRQTEADQTSMDFGGLDLGTYDDYAFLVTAHHEFYEPLRNLNESCTSPYAGRQLVIAAPLAVDQVGMEDATMKAPAVFYDLTGNMVAQPNHGIYIKVQGGKATKVRM